MTRSELNQEIDSLIEQHLALIECDYELANELEFDIQQKYVQIQELN